jgi:hypothetical protein
LDDIALVREVRNCSPPPVVFGKATKGNVLHIHEEMPFGIGVLFDLEHCEGGAETFNF